MTSTYSAPRSKSEYEGDTKALAERLRERFAEFIRKREEWDSIIDREKATVLQAEFHSTQQGIDYRSPDAEKAIEEMVDVIVATEPILSIKPLEPGERAKKAASDQLKWHARSWEIQNAGNRWTTYVSHGQIRHGVATPQKCWREPGKDSYGDRPTREQLRMRRHPFYWKFPAPLGVLWQDHDGEDEISIYEYEMSVLDAAATTTLERPGDKMRPTVDSAGKLGWLGPDELPDKSLWGKKLKVTVVDKRDLKNIACPVEGCDHFLRKVCVYVSAGGGSPELVDEYVSPFAGSSFYVVSGRETPQADPHKKYRPILYPLYTELVWYNYLMTLTVTIARGEADPRRVYAEMQAQSAGLVNENGDQVVPIPQADDESVPMIQGKLERWPQVLSEYLPIAIQESRARLEEYKPNRFLLGTNYEEAKSGSATNNMMGLQQAQLPFDRLEDQQAEAILRSHRDERHAILFWAATGYEEDFALATSSTEGVAGEAVESGEVVYVNASKMKTRTQLYLKTKSQTQQEEIENEAYQRDRLNSGLIDMEQYFEYTGWPDAAGQVARMFKQHAAQVYGPRLDMLVTMLLDKLIAVKLGVETGMPPPMAPPSPMMLPPGGGGGNSAQGGYQMKPPPVQSASGSAGGVR